MDNAPPPDGPSHYARIGVAIVDHDDPSKNSVLPNTLVWTITGGPTLPLKDNTFATIGVSSSAALGAAVSIKYLGVARERAAEPGVVAVCVDGYATLKISKECVETEAFTPGCVLYGNSMGWITCQQNAYPLGAPPTHHPDAGVRPYSKIGVLLPSQFPKGYLSILVAH
jgi:hypothetical protein